MKTKFITTTICFLFIAVLSASAQKGKFYLSGSVGFESFDNSSSISSQDPSEFNGTQLSLLPDIGIFLKDDLQVGVRLGYNQRDSEASGFFPQENSENVFSPGLYVRKIFAVNDKFAFHAGLGANLNNGSGRRTSFDGPDMFDEYTISGFVVNLPVGVMYQVTEKITFIASYDFISYTSRTEQIDSMDDDTTKELNLGLRAENPRFAPLTAGFFFVLN